MTAVKQASFAGGEIAPALYGRRDLVKYETGARRVENFIVRREGGVANRPGTQFVGEVVSSAAQVRLIKFVFNSDQTYILEFSDQKMRVIRNGAYVTETGVAITAISLGATTTVTAAGHGLSNGDHTYISGIVGTTQLNGRTFKVAGVSGDNFNLTEHTEGTAIDSSSYTAWSSGGTTAELFTLTTPYVTADLQTLNYVQSADVITIVHPSYQPRELARTGHTSWTLTAITTAPTITAPTSPSATSSAGAGFDWRYVITAVQAETFEESLPSTTLTFTDDAAPTAAAPIRFSWTAPVGFTVQEYNIYRQKAVVTGATAVGVFGYIGTASGLSFTDDGSVDPDFTDTPPLTRALFASTNNYPSVVAYYQQRKVYGNTNTDPETVWTSRSGFFNNFSIRSPIQDDDAVTFTLAGRQVNEITGIVELGTLIIFTTGGEWSVAGDANGILKPGDVNPKQHTYNGSSTLAPLLINGTALYVQGRGSVIRDLGFDFDIDGYRGNDLTVFASHLFDKYTLRDWDYQQIPHSVVWAVRSDGTLLGMTYVREHEVRAWHKHTFPDATVEQVCVVPEGDEDAVYLVVKRTIGALTKRYVERMATRQVEDVEDCVFMDCSLSLDGTNTGATTMTLSGGTDWEFDETLTLTASAAFFSALDVGNAIFLTGSDTDNPQVRFTIDAFTNTTVVTGRVHRTVTTTDALRNTATTAWARAVDQIGGLWHLEGKTISVLGDGQVIASPNNEEYTTITVSSGVATLDRPYAVLHAGLPYMSSLETLDIEALQGTIATQKANLSKMNMFVQDSRGGFAGDRPPTDDDDDPLQGLQPIQRRDDEEYGTPVDLATETLDVTFAGGWAKEKRTFIRQVDPLPLTILSVAPEGYIPSPR